MVQKNKYQAFTVSKVLLSSTERPTRHITDYLGDHLPSQSVHWCKEHGVADNDKTKLNYNQQVT